MKLIWKEEKEVKVTEDRKREKIREFTVTQIPGRALSGTDEYFSEHYSVMISKA